MWPREAGAVRAGLLKRGDGRSGPTVAVGNVTRIDLRKTFTRRFNVAPADPEQSLNHTQGENAFRVNPAGSVKSALVQNARCGWKGGHLCFFFPFLAFDFFSCFLLSPNPYRSAGFPLINVRRQR